MFTASDQDWRLLDSFMAFVRTLISLMEQCESVSSRLGMHMTNHLAAMSLYGLRSLLRDLEAFSGMLDSDDGTMVDLSSFGRPQLASTAVNDSEDGSEAAPALPPRGSKPGAEAGRM